MQTGLSALQSFFIVMHVGGRPKTYWPHFCLVLRGPYSGIQSVLGPIDCV